MAGKGMIPVLILAAVITASAGGCAGKSGSLSETGALDRTATAPAAKDSDTGENPSVQAEDMPRESQGAGNRQAAKAPEGQGKEQAAEEEREAGGPGEPQADTEPETLAGKTDKRKDIEAFAERIQEAVADRNLEAIADLTAFPFQLVTTDGEELYFKNRNEFLKQNPDLIFGDDIMMVIANIDTATLELTQEGVVMGETKGPHIRYAMGASGGFGIVKIQE